MGHSLLLWHEIDPGMKSIDGGCTYLPFSVHIIYPFALAVHMYRFLPSLNTSFSLFFSLSFSFSSYLFVIPACVFLFTYFFLFFSHSLCIYFPFYVHLYFSLSSGGVSANLAVSPYDLSSASRPTASRPLRPSRHRTLITPSRLTPLVNFFPCCIPAVSVFASHFLFLHSWRCAFPTRLNA